MYGYAVSALYVSSLHSVPSTTLSFIPMPTFTPSPIREPTRTLEPLRTIAEFTPTRRLLLEQSISLEMSGKRMVLKQHLPALKEWYGVCPRKSNLVPGGDSRIRGRIKPLWPDLSVC